MRTISVRLDDASAARLDSLCQTLGLSQSEVVKASLALLQRQSASPAALAERLGLIGCFSSGDPVTGSTRQAQNHSAVLRQKLGRQLQQQRQITPRSAI
jgi:Arc/MetJ-type ribon-helix-helix transcriptional regulator